jgi:hypothetical protein
VIPNEIEGRNPFPSQATASPSTMQERQRRRHWRPEGSCVALMGRHGAIPTELQNEVDS